MNTKLKIYDKSFGFKTLISWKLRQKSHQKGEITERETRKQFIKLCPLCTIQSKYLPLKQFQGLVCLLLNGPNEIISGSLHYNRKWAYYNGTLYFTFNWPFQIILTWWNLNSVGSILKRLVAATKSDWKQKQTKQIEIKQKKNL